MLNPLNALYVPINISNYYSTLYKHYHFVTSSSKQLGTALCKTGGLYLISSSLEASLAIAIGRVCYYFVVLRAYLSLSL